MKKDTIAHRYKDTLQMHTNACARYILLFHIAVHLYNRLARNRYAYMMADQNGLSFIQQKLIALLEY